MIHHIANFQGGTVGLATSASYATTATNLVNPFIAAGASGLSTIINNGAGSNYATATVIDPTTSGYTILERSITKSSTGFTPTQTGYYQITFNIGARDTGGANTLFYFMIGVNGAAYTVRAQSIVSNFESIQTLNTVASVSAGQLIDFRIGTTGGDSITFGNFDVIISKVG